MPYRDADRLGPVIREHRFNAGPVTVGMSVLFVVMGLYLWQTSWGTLSVGLSIASLAFAALFLGNYWLSAGTRVVVHERGLVHVDKRGTRTLEWDDIESIRSHYERKDGQLYQWHRLVPRGGDAQSALLVGSGLSELAALVDEIFAHTDERLTARARSTIAAGERVSFGALWADREGLHRGEEVSPWGHAQMTLAEGIATIAGLSGQVPAREIENLRVLQALVTDPPLPPPRSGL